MSFTKPHAYCVCCSIVFIFYGNYYLLSFCTISFRLDRGQVQWSILHKVETYMSMLVYVLLSIFTTMNYL